jgi:hypothetical protein
MTDTHLRILRMAARHSQRRLDEHDAAEGSATAASAEQRQALKTRATRTEARVAAAQARRRHAPTTLMPGYHGSTDKQ